MRAVRHFISTGDECGGSICDELEVGTATKANMKWSLQDRGLHGFRRITCKTRITIHTIHGQWSQSDTRHLVIEKINTRVAFISPLEYAVVCSRLTRVVFVERRFVFAHSINSG